MSTWNTDDMASALPKTGPETGVDAGHNNAPLQPAAVPANPNKAQELGWAPKVAYDYESYAKSNKELMEAHIAFTGEQRYLSFIAPGIGAQNVRNK